MGRDSLRTFIVASAALVSAAFARPAQAVEIGPSGAPGSVDIHGFVSQGAILSTGNNYLAKSKRGSFELTEVGINFTVPLTDRLRAGLQLFSRDLGPIGNYVPRADWFYLDYRFADWLGFRAGRVKLPFGLYNDSSDADSARVPILLPQSTYPIQNRDFLLAQTGFEIYGRLDLRAAGALEYRHYVGTIFLDTSSQTSLTTRVEEIDIPYVAGERLVWETPIEGLRAAGSLQALRLDARFLHEGKPVDFELPVVLWTGSLEYAAHDLLVAAEYGRWYGRYRSSDPALLPTGETTNERAYLMTSYRVAPWFVPGAYYSLFFPDTRRREGRANVQHDIAATLRFDLNAHWLLKLEGHFMSGTAGLSSALNSNRPLGELEPNWGVFLAKTTVYF
ncbi:MAG: hypothetical protein KF819_21690 [Labilithrix sp.]|nr:hypothetical protein [Labilithrix sp.]